MKQAYFQWKLRTETATASQDILEPVFFGDTLSNKLINKKSPFAGGLMVRCKVYYRGIKIRYVK